MRSILLFTKGKNVPAKKKKTSPLLRKRTPLSISRKGQADIARTAVQNIKPYPKRR